MLQIAKVSSSHAQNQLAVKVRLCYSLNTSQCVEIPRLFYHESTKEPKLSQIYQKFYGRIACFLAFAWKNIISFQSFTYGICSFCGKDNFLPSFCPSGFLPVVFENYQTKHSYTTNDFLSNIIWDTTKCFLLSEYLWNMTCCDTNVKEKDA